MDREQIKSAIAKALEEKGTRKFTQSVDVGINFKNVDFNKQENRLNLEIMLPKGKGREQKLAVFADGQLAMDARTAGADLVIAGDEIPRLAADNARLKELLDYELLAAPNLMAVVGKHLGQVLGTKGRLPRPIMGGSIKDLAERAKRTVKLKSKGKFLPVAHVSVGAETMSADDLTENVEAVIEKVTAKVGQPNIKSIYVKLTMGKPVYIGVKPGAEAAAPAAQAG